MQVYHLRIEYDKEKNILVYDRKLEKGSGPSIYGLIVCEAMGMTKDFVSYAKQIQNKLTENEICDKKLSQYNNNIFMNHCHICFKKNNLETHHIKDQQFADENQMIDNHHKNIKHNLVPLCKDCHLKVTNHQYIVKGWKETSEGKILDWHKVETSKVVCQRKSLVISNKKK